MKKILKKIIGYIRRHAFLANICSELFYIVTSIQYYWYDMIWAFQGYKMPNRAEIEDFKENVTFIYKSFERQKLAKRLYHNIQHYYPGVRVIIADDSSKPLTIQNAGENLSIIQLPFNSGLSLGLAKALERVDTKYVVRMDDDELLTRRTRFEKQLSFLREHKEIDIASVPAFTAPICKSIAQEVEDILNRDDMSDSKLPLIIPHRTKIDESHIVCGKGANMFIAETDKIRAIGYDVNVRMLDHRFFYWRAAGKLVTVVDREGAIFHTHSPFDGSYQSYRSDVDSDRRYIWYRMMY